MGRSHLHHPDDRRRGSRKRQGGDGGSGDVVGVNIIRTIEARPSLIGTAFYEAVSRMVWDSGANHSPGPDCASDLFAANFCYIDTILVVISPDPFHIIIA